MSNKNNDLNESQLNQVAGGGYPEDPEEDVADAIAKLVDAFNKGDISKKYLYERKNELLSYLDEQQ